MAGRKRKLRRTKGVTALIREHQKVELELEERRLWESLRMDGRNNRNTISKLDSRDIDPVRLIYQLALLGASDTQMAKALGIGTTTLDKWKADRPEFLRALRAGREQADSEVARSLFQRAKGYCHPDTHISVIKDRETGQIEVVTTPFLKHYPPDTTACIFWLKNRRKNEWRDVQRSEISGPNGTPIEQVIKKENLDLSNLTDDELALAERIGLVVTTPGKPEDKSEVKDEL